MFSHRLTIVGPASDLKTFDRKSRWSKGVTQLEVLELSGNRQAWQFESATVPLQRLKRLSRRWPLLSFLLDYDSADNRIKGLAKAKNGKLQQYQFGY